MTTNGTRRAVRWGAMGGVIAVGAGVAIAIGADPYPASNQPRDAALAQLEARERAVAEEARRVDAQHAARWSAYRARLAERQREIAAVQAANARTRAANATVATPAYSTPAYSAPAATYVPAPPVASSGSS